MLYLLQINMVCCLQLLPWIDFLDFQRNSHEKISKPGGKTVTLKFLPSCSNRLKEKDKKYFNAWKRKVVSCQTLFLRKIAFSHQTRRDENGRSQGLIFYLLYLNFELKYKIFVFNSKIWVGWTKKTHGCAHFKHVYEKSHSINHFCSSLQFGTWITFVHPYNLACG